VRPPHLATSVRQQYLTQFYVSQLLKLLFLLFCVHIKKLGFNKTNSLPGFLKPQQKGCQKLHSSINCLVFVSAKQQKTRKWSFGVCFNC
jgi:hypothetical protein